MNKIKLDTGKKSYTGLIPTAGYAAPEIPSSGYVELPIPGTLYVGTIGKLKVTLLNMNYEDEPLEFLEVKGNFPRVVKAIWNGTTAGSIIVDVTT